MASNIDMSYNEKVLCGAVSGSTKITYEIGVSATNQCRSGIIWYPESDCQIIKKEGTIDIDRTDLEISGTNYKRTQSGLIEEKLEFEIKPNINGKFHQKLLEIQMIDSAQNYDGKYIRDYADGGFHLRIKAQDEQTGLNMNVVYTSLKASSLPSALMQDFNDAEASFEFNLTNEHQPYFELFSMPEGWGIPTGVNAPKIELGTITNESGSVQITPTGTNFMENGIVDEIIIKYQDALGNDLGQTQGKSGVMQEFSNAEVGQGKTYKIYYGYFIAPNLPFFIGNKIEIGE